MTTKTAKRTYAAQSSTGVVATKTTTGQPLTHAVFLTWPHTGETVINSFHKTRKAAHSEATWSYNFKVSFDANGNEVAHPIAEIVEVIEA